MAYSFYLVSVIGALGLWLMMPRVREWPRPVGGLLLAGAIGGLFLIIGQNTPPAYRPNIYFYLFTAIALATAIRVITHTRPVYSAMYFVLVVLAVAGLFVLLEAEFMAFAMIIIYGGAILVTYMFVIMLATMPQTSENADEAPRYDRQARQPFWATVFGFSLLAVICSVMYSEKEKDLGPRRGGKLDMDFMATANQLPGKLTGVLRALEDTSGLSKALRDHGLIEPHANVAAADGFGVKIDGWMEGPKISATLDLTMRGGTKRQVTLNAAVMEALKWAPSGLSQKLRDAVQDEVIKKLNTLQRPVQSVLVSGPLSGGPVVVKLTYGDGQIEKLSPDAKGRQAVLQELNIPGDLPKLATAPKLLESTQRVAMVEPTGSAIQYSGAMTVTLSDGGTREVKVDGRLLDKVRTDLDFSGSVSRLMKNDAATIATLDRVLKAEKLIGEQEKVAGVDWKAPGVLAGGSLKLTLRGGDKPERVIPVSMELIAGLDAEVGNITWVGQGLFQGHTLGIELAGVILLLSMVGAVVIARRKVADNPVDDSLKV